MDVSRTWTDVSRTWTDVSRDQTDDTRFGEAFPAWPRGLRKARQRRRRLHRRAPSLRPPGRTKP